MKLAPIVVFAYNRLDHLKFAISALCNAELSRESDLFVYSDGPRNEVDRGKVNAVRSYLSTVSGFASVNIITRDENLGLSASVIDGVTEICEKFGKIIILEDDIVVSPYFLRYMNQALELYKYDEEVISIHAYLYSISERLPGDTFFIKGADCWGWATWDRGWKLFEKDGSKLLGQLKHRGLVKEFDLDGSYPYSRMLKRQVKGVNDSWAIRWYASAFLKNKLTLYPAVSMVKNIGHDKSGTHSYSTDIYDVHLSDSAIEVTRIEKQESKLARKLISNFLRKTEKQQPYIFRLIAKFLN